MFLRNYANGWICLAPRTLRLCKTVKLYQSVNYVCGAKAKPRQAVGHLIHCQEQMPPINPSTSIYIYIFLATWLAHM